jgi:hypothetical protein
MQILRHSKIAITMEIYTEVVSSRTHEALANDSRLLRAILTMRVADLP